MEVKQWWVEQLGGGQKGWQGPRQSTIGHYDFSFFPRWESTKGFEQEVTIHFILKMTLKVGWTSDKKSGNREMGEDL